MHLEIEYSALTHILDPSGGVKKVIHFSFLKMVMLHIKLRERSVDKHVSKNFGLTLTPDLCCLVERSDIEIVQIYFLLN